MFNPHNNVTSDGIRIREGLAVFTNELKVGKVIADPDRREVRCCDTVPTIERHEVGSQRYYRDMQAWFTDQELMVNARDGGCYCGHDHWFTIETKDGTISMNGERLATIAFGDIASEKVDW
jgi:hypothetical protein